MSEKLLYIFFLLGFFPILLAKINKRKTNFRAFFIEPFSWLVVFSTIYEYLFSLLLQINPVYWFRLYLLLEFLALYYYFYNLLNKKYKPFFYSFMALYLILFIYLLFIWDMNESMKTDSYLSTLETIFVFCCSFLWFKKMFTHLSETSLLVTPHFYFVSGFILYFFGTFFLFLASDFILKNMKSEFLSYWNINILFNIFLRTLLIIGIWKIPQKLAP